jgi:hypothetical protein
MGQKKFKIKSVRENFRLILYKKSLNTKMEYIKHQSKENE